jgi:hypothetical protein
LDPGSANGRPVVSLSKRRDDVEAMVACRARIGWCDSAPTAVTGLVAIGVP